MNTKIIRTISEMRKISSNWPTSVGFVPTMGFLHEGHLSLIKTAQKDNETTVVSIYVNPAQFGPQEDLSEYPRDLEKDIELLAELNVGYVFLPDDGEMYPKNFKTWIQVEDITEIMCGIARPTHFKGVTTIVNKLLNIVRPDTIYLGAVGDPRVPSGILERGILLKLRFYFDQYINLRPIKLYKDELSPLKNKGVKEINFTVIRENTEGLYSGIGGFLKKGTADEVATQEMVNTKQKIADIQINFLVAIFFPFIFTKIGIILQRMN